MMNCGSPLGVNCYVHQVFSSPKHTDLHWLIVSREKLPPDAQIILYLVHSPKSLNTSSLQLPDASIYALPVGKDFYQHEVGLFYDQTQQELQLERGRDRVKLPLATAGRGLELSKLRQY